jgi:excisionase family DNA binding protein
MTSLLEQLQSETGYMTLQEVSHIMGIHRMTLRKWAKSHKIEAVRIGDQIKFDPSVVAE